MFKLSRRSLNRLAGVHPDLAALVARALEVSTVDFAVLEGLRSIDRQKELVKKGASQTMNSRHLTGHAVDLGAYVAGAISWDWPHYREINKAMMEAAGDMKLPLEWGGNWTSIKDGPHFQLPWADYPPAGRDKETRT
jgi:peptidoglycan L-alanyl-D-glutamate endopeptidase CwlK